MIERCVMRCANPDCDVEAMYFRSGSLYWVDGFVQTAGAPRRGKARLIWLCGECSKKVVVETWRPAGEQVRYLCGEVIAIDRERHMPPATAKPAHPVSQSA